MCVCVCVSLSLSPPPPLPPSPPPPPPPPISNYLHFLFAFCVFLASDFALFPTGQENEYRSQCYNKADSTSLPSPPPPPAAPFPLSRTPSFPTVQLSCRLCQYLLVFTDILAPLDVCSWPAFNFFLCSRILLDYTYRLVIERRA